MTDPPLPEANSAHPDRPLPAFPTLNDPTATFTAGPDTAGQLSRTYVRYMTFQLRRLAWLMAYAVTIIALASAAWGEGGALLALFTVLIIAWRSWVQTQQTEKVFEQRLGRSYADGAVSTARHGAEAADFASPTTYFRLYHADIGRLEVRGSVIVIRLRSPMFHVIPRELFPDSVLKRLSETGLKISGYP
ncbi:hypothetical protein [Nocardia miyunensis]|uniref:hypothetical protein n=1 Tax=Nocardia miyunensis TaxID=282684 RepID=UPI0012F527B6|nr:hypothetical protein [Nocardia miyunensis]